MTKHETFACTVVRKLTVKTGCQETNIPFTKQLYYLFNYASAAFLYHI